MLHSHTAQSTLWRVPATALWNQTVSYTRSRAPQRSVASASTRRAAPGRHVLTSTARWAAGDDPTDIRLAESSGDSVCSHGSSPTPRLGGSRERSRWSKTALACGAATDDMGDNAQHAAHGAMCAHSTLEPSTRTARVDSAALLCVQCAACHTTALTDTAHSRVHCQPTQPLPPRRPTSSSAHRHTTSSSSPLGHLQESHLHSSHSLPDLPHWNGRHACFP